LTEVNLLVDYPRSKRPIAARKAATVEARAAARQFGRAYFDGDRTEGYGGYKYDGRWVPIARRFIAHYGLTSASRILDVGCAKGFLLHDLAQLVPGISVCGLDISSYALEHVMGSLRGRTVRGNAAALPFASRSFDVVISINTIHNLERDPCAAALREIERVGARKYVQVDSWLSEQQRQDFADWQLTARTYFDPDGWRTLFDEAGYSGDYYWTLTE
jgi:SAM-dependent methyltransferase